MKKVRLLAVLILALVFMNQVVFASEVAEANASQFGVLTLLPPLVAIALAFITKNVILSLFIGALTGGFLLSILNKNVFSALIAAFLDFVQRALSSLSDSWNAGIILQVLLIGGVINLVAKMGGAKAIAEALVKRAKTPRSAQLITWMLGILVFFDDYANSLIVGPMMRPVFDKMKISRERLAFIVDATAAPIAGIAIISTWIGLEVGLIRDGFLSVGQEVDAFGVFLSTIPFRFYNILMLFCVFITAYLLKDLGPMKKAQDLALQGKSKVELQVIDAASDLEPKAGVRLSVWNAIIPIGTLIVAALLSFYFSGYDAIMGGEDILLIDLVSKSPLSFEALRECIGASDASVALFQSALFAGIVAIAMSLVQRIFTIKEAINVWLDGLKALLVTCVILILAWSLSSVIKELGTAVFLKNYLKDSIAPFLLPSLIFIFGSFISFATGTSYGTMGILMPLAIPLAHSVNPEMSFVVVCTSAVLTGAIFGDHCSPISDTTILSSMGAGCEHISHVNTQMPYALLIAGATLLLGYIPAGLGVPVWIILPVVMVVIGLFIHFFGKTPAGESLSNISAFIRSL